MSEYAFDIKLAAIVRIRAPSLQKAEQALTNALDCANLDVKIQQPVGGVRLTEASVWVDDVEHPYLFEVDGVSVDDLE